MILLSAASLLATLAPQDPTAEDHGFFREKVAPLLQEHCLACHGSGERLRGGLWLTRREGLLEGGESGPTVNLQDPQQSLLLAKTSYRDEQHQMPPRGKLPEEQLQILGDWIERGLPWDEAVSFEEHAVEEERLTKGDGQEGWAYEPVERPEVPAVEGDWARTPVDAFLLSKLRAAGLEPAPEIDRTSWLRRVTFDLTGLPPSPEETAAFLADASEEAHARVVDRLLASPHYGERWGRHWLDVARYAETNGFERDTNKPEIWRYRDWVVRAFNEDLPYDDFIRYQLAGDELEQVTHDSLIATGFLRCMQWDDEPPEGVVQARYDVLDDIVRTTSEGFLASTLGCARCHDHKGDPFDQTDYYSFMSFFEGLTNYRTEGWLVPILTAEEEQEFEREKQRHAEELQTTREDLQALESRFRAALATQGKGGGRHLLSNLRYRFYRDSFRGLPDFDQLRHEDEGRLSGGLVDLSPATRGENYGFVFEGELRIPSTGDWDVVLDADDGARLILDGRTLIEYDRTGPLGTPQRARVHLQEGSFPVRIEFFQWVGGAALQLALSPAKGSLWAYRFEDPGQGWQEPDYDDGEWLRGPGGFGTQGTPKSEIGTLWNSEAIWLRQSFDWDPTVDQDPVWVGHYDDDLAVYINGVEALKTTGYVTSYGLLELSEAAKAALVPGTNTLALHCIQDFGGQYVHGRIVSRAEALSGQLADVAFGRFQLSASQRADGRDLAQLIDQQGAALLGQEAVQQHQALRKRLRHMQDRPPKPPRMANVATERGPTAPLMKVHVRGSALAQGQEVPIAFPVCIDETPPQLPAPAPEAKSTGRRLALANWIVSPDNPLTARVMVNRIWQHHFGVGLVPSASDFGELGERPSHPELLDWLASEFVAQGWSVKAMHRLMLESAAYRMDSKSHARGREADPTNQLLWHFRPRRLSAEELRDSVLWLTGQLNTQIGGKSFFSIMPEQALATSSRPEAVWGKSSPEDQRRRSLYIKVKRSLVTPLLAAFDLADTDSSCPQRYTTTSPSQALGLLNGKFAQTRAAEFAQRVAREVPEDRAGQVALALRLALGREPEPADSDNALALWQELVDQHGMSEDQARRQVCLYVVNLNEFVYVD